MPSSPACTCLSCPAHPGDARGQRARAKRCEGYPASAITDAQWAVIEPLLPAPDSAGGRGGRPEKHQRRPVLDAVFYLVHGGVPWRELPREFPPPSTVWTFFTRWVRTGVWARVHEALVGLLRVAAGRRPPPSAAIIDSQSVRAADTVPTCSRGCDAGKRVNGRKRHIAVDTSGLLAVLVTVAGIQDRDGGLHLLARLRESSSTITWVWANAGYAGRLVTFTARVWRLTLAVVKKADDQVGFKVLHRRWVVERTFAWIGKHRRCMRDYATRIDTSEAMVTIAVTTSRHVASPVNNSSWTRSECSSSTPPPRSAALPAGSYPPGFSPAHPPAHMRCLGRWRGGGGAGQVSLRLYRGAMRAAHVRRRQRPDPAARPPDHPPLSGGSRVGRGREPRPCRSWVLAAV